MATKTVVCPECGSSAAPGRYACAECGALLAAVGAAPRTWSRGDASTAGVAPAMLASDARASVDAPETHLARTDGIPDETDASGWETVQTAELADDEIDGWTPPPGARTEAALPRVEAEAAGPALAPAGEAAALPGSAAEPAWPAPPDSSPLAAPGWPPANDPGVRPLPVERVPAGAWLPPSARLEGLEPPAAVVAEPKRRPRVGLGSLSESLGIPAQAPRQVVAIGAAVAAVSFLLPWANVLAGAGLLGGYFTQWGLAGPGHWIVVALLAGLGAAAIGGERTAAIPVGLLGLVAAALLVGLLWPYLFGLLGRSVGVWGVLAGALVLAVGSVLEQARRHAHEDPSVH